MWSSLFLIHLKILGHTSFASHAEEVSPLSCPRIKVSHRTTAFIFCSFQCWDGKTVGRNKSHIGKMCQFETQSQCYLLHLLWCLLPGILFCEGSCSSGLVGRITVEQIDFQVPEQTQCLMVTGHPAPSWAFSTAFSHRDSALSKK